MRKSWVPALAIGVVASIGLSAHPAYAGDPLKPYVVLILDTSGSMEDPTAVTGSGPPSCGGFDTKLDHARCAINKIVNSYGDMVLSLGRFRETTSGTVTTSCDLNNDRDGNVGVTLPTPSGGDQCSTQGAYCGDCNITTGQGEACSVLAPCSTGTCTGGVCVGYGSCTIADREFEILTPLIDGNNHHAALWTDFSCGSCSVPTPGVAPTTANELWGVSPYTWTPLAAVMNGAKLYWKGQALASDGTTVIWPATAAGFAPIAADPTNTAFLPTGCNASPTCTTNCCASQCRPYITILLTDGAESCTNFPNTTAAAAAMLTTDVGGRRYRIETKPIGFGIPPGDAQIEAIAHAGGEPNVAGNQGYYATDEASLQLAISAILDDAIKTEVCNNLDDDCDVLVDEGFNKGQTCDNGRLGVCRRTGTTECRVDGTGVQCNAPAGPAAGTEICNNLDDDCDGKIDETGPAPGGVPGGCTTCTPQQETCNGMSDDCDAAIDEGPIQRQCGTGVCLGVETCLGPPSPPGTYGGCTAQTPTNETCNGLDDDCDGVRDGFTQKCSNLPGSFPVGDPRNNPGNTPTSVSPGCIAEGPAICLCHPGNKTCPANVGPPNAFGACIGEVGPATEVCNGLDDDCDGRVDEGTGGADCSTNCGTGLTVCMNGTLSCNATTQPTDDTCDNVDDDCDGMIDEDYVSSGACGQGPPATVCMGLEQCIAGVETCVGDPIGTESCNCNDDDCDTRVDENVMCGGGASCISCQCAFPCAGGEFPCPLGKACSNGFCVEDPCFGVDCPPVGGSEQVCQVQGNAGVCVDSCSLVTCTGGLVCQPSTGDCVPDNCASFPDKCTAAENCVTGVCVSNPCANVTCDSGQYCVGGQCFGSCAGVDCPTGERCRMGVCQDDPCDAPCPSPQVCNDDSGMCMSNPCQNVICAGGQWCDPNGDGQCENDPCLGTACPDPAQECRGGTCDDPVNLTNDANATEEHVTTGGGGGCSTGGEGSLGSMLVGLVALARMLRRRSRRHP